MKTPFWKGMIVFAATLGLAGAAVAQEQPAPTPTPAPATPPATPPQDAPKPPEGTPTTPSGAQPRMELSATEWNFGTVWQGEDQTFKITVSNAGNAPLQITSVKTSCGCTAAHKPKEVLSPGESDTLEIVYNAKKKVGPANQTVTVTSNDPLKPSVGIKVSGDVKQLYKLNPPTGLAFGRLVKDTVESRTLEIENTYTDKMFLKLKGDQNRSGPFKLEFKEVDAGTKYSLTVSTVPPLALGTAQADLIIETGITRMPEINIPIRAFVQERVVVSPKEVYVPKTLARPLERPVNVQYLASKPLNITAVKCNVPQITATLAPPQPNQPNEAGVFKFHRVNVTIPAGEVVPEEGVKLEIMTDDPEYAVLTVDITSRRPQPVKVAPGAKQPAGAATPAPGATLTPATPAAPEAPKPDAPKPDAPKPAEPGKP
jgi:hypothetical protein